MKTIRPADRIDVKRSFVITPFLRRIGIAGRYHTKPPTRVQYLAALKKANRAVEKLSEKQLDRRIDYPKRLRSYNKAEWFLAVTSPSELGVWKGAGGLPLAWTRGSLAQAAKKFKAALDKDSKEIRKRSKRAVPAILQFKSIMKKEKYLLPIVFKSGFGTNGRKGLPKMKGDIDDGCMRCIAFAIGGDKIYYGVPAKK